MGGGKRIKGRKEEKETSRPILAKPKLLATTIFRSSASSFSIPMDSLGGRMN